MIYDKLSGNKRIPMHMPGHKRNTALAPYLKHLGADLDITEITDFDNLHAPCGIIGKSQEKAAKLRGAEYAFYLVGGSTAGILASVSAIVEQGDKVICARNCHKSVYNALELTGADTIFVMPKIHKTGISGSVTPCEIEEKIKENPDTRLVIITSPTYEGVVSDIAGICKVAHSYNIPVLVDSAHGAHLGFTEDFLPDAISCGADISVESLHKTLPSLTQTAACYLNSKLISKDKLADKLAVFQSSSPSYLLMASIDGCMNLIEKQGEELFSKWNERLLDFHKKCEALSNLQILKNDGDFFGLDKSKLVIFTHSGKWLFDALGDMGIECEMVAPNYVVAMTGMGDTKEMLSYFATCLLKLDKQAKKPEFSNKTAISVPQKAMDIKMAKMQGTEGVTIAEANERISARYVWAYPPGTPIIAPGEIISEEICRVLESYLDSGTEVLKNLTNDTISVIK